MGSQSDTKGEDADMARELASIRETVDLSPQDVLDRAQDFLTEQGYRVTRRDVTTLTAERYPPNDVERQDKRTLTIDVQHQVEGGVRVRVLGNDIEGVQERQAEWLGWSESLPKRKPEGQQTASTRASDREGGMLPGAKTQQEAPTWGQRTREGFREGFGTTTASTSSVPKPTSSFAGGPEILSKKLRKLVEQNKHEGEKIEFCLLSGDIGGWNQAIVALTDRLLVIKPGFMAGATFGSRVTSFYYRDITGIEVNTGLINGVIEINTPSYQGTGQKDFWNIKNEDRDPYKVTNCLPISKFNLKEYKPYIDRVRAMVREAKHERVASSPPQSGSSLSSELEKLASLQASGVLTDEEFQRAKQRLLD
jgi:hypothetical protein